MPVKSLYVWNDDEFAARHGFPLHHHRDVEIIAYVRSRVVTHEDTLGNSYEISAGDVQVMSTGSGVRHSEYNRSAAPLKIFQIWISPNQLGGKPTYASRRFPGHERANHLVVLASGLPRNIESHALPLRADARLLAERLRAGRKLTYQVSAGHDLYLVPATGQVSINGVMANAGDGVAVTKEAAVEFKALQDTEPVVVDLA